MPPHRTVLLGHWELSSATACLPRTPADGRILLVESAAYFRAMPHHRRKVVLILSAIRHLADALTSLGYEVDLRRAECYHDAVLAHARAFHPSEIVVQEPAEFGVWQSLTELARSGEVPLRIIADRRFMVSRRDFRAWARDRDSLVMEDFYRAQRRRWRILLNRGGRPIGGRWNFDGANRRGARSLRRRERPVEPIRFAPDAITEAVMEEVAGMAGLWGSLEGFDLPVTRAGAEAALNDFLDHRLAEFGPWQDAMLAGETHLFHARLSAAMNVGLLHPRRVIARAIERYTRAPDRVPLQSIEGFVRQILGWREYVNGIYWLRMPDYRHANHFGATAPLPQLFWDPTTSELRCVAESVRMVRDHGYAHHIHRLMVLCNFAVLAGVDPLRLSEWFWAAFADAYEWVELPNVVGMGTYGDGGLLGTKPYVSSAAYLARMSDYCDGCRFSPLRRTGDDACPFNYLYWTFLDDLRRSGLRAGQRMDYVLSQLERIGDDELAAMREVRSRFLARVAPDTTGWSFDHTLGEPAVVSKRAPVASA